MTPWSLVPKRDLLTEENLERVGSALDSDGVVFGWCHVYGGGGAGGRFAFSDFATYRDKVRDSKPGDKFVVVYGLDSILPNAVLRLGAPHSDELLWPMTCSLDPVKQMVAGGQEILVVWRFIAPDGDKKCDFDTLWEVEASEWEELTEQWENRRGELVFFSEALLDDDENVVIVGKRPDALGFTPERGPY